MTTQSLYRDAHARIFSSVGVDGRIKSGHDGG